MKKNTKNLLNQSGLAVPLVMIIVTLAVSSISYLTLNLIPRLQSEVKKTQNSIQYKLFLTSINDYLVHAIREKWCINKIEKQDEIVTTDLLLSNDCSSTKSMEEIVTFPGNLERILWDGDTIGSDTAPSPNTILGLHHQTHPIPTLKRSMIEISKIKLHLSENVIKDMNDQHPLFIIIREVKSCIKSIDIEIAKDFVSTGDEKKISINIKGNVYATKPSCFSVKALNTITRYTFYPRRLHTFSLIKYGDLNTDLFHEYHGPVYVAGNLILPDESFKKSKSSIFYNTLSLGIFNEGKTGGVFAAGKIKTHDGEDYTFEERGHPYISKQHNYENFRGMIGGLRLDPSEDKGLHNIFNYNSTSSADIDLLEKCIDVNQIKTKPSRTAGTKLAYSGISNSAGTTTLKLGLTKRNRFKPTIYAPKILSQPAASAGTFLVSLNPTSGLTEIGELEIKLGAEEYHVTTAAGAVVHLNVHYQNLGLTNAILDSAITTLNGPLNKNNIGTILPSIDVYNQLLQKQQFINKATAFKNKCETAPSNHCTDLGYIPTCTDPLLCDHSNEKMDMQNAQNALKLKLIEIKNLISTPAQLTLTLNNLPPVNGKTIINQKNLEIKFSSNWAPVMDLINSTIPDNMLITFTPYHYSLDPIKFMAMHNLMAPLDELKLYRQDNTSNAVLLTGWKNSFDNSSLDFAEVPEDIVELECPDGMNLADWSQDMSGSTNFSWNYANTLAGAEVDTSDHSNLPLITFEEENLPQEGHKNSYSKSVVENCVVEKTRKFVFGFYACKTLEIKGGRNEPLHMIGTFIIENLINPNLNVPTYWHSVWDAKAASLILSELNKNVPFCQTILGKTWSDVIGNTTLKNDIKACSPLDLVSNGPNNFMWSTVDPDIGLIPGQSMTSHKVNRIQRWIVTEESRMESFR